MSTFQLPAPFRAFAEHIAIDLPGGHALFTTRRGGVSDGSFSSLNLGAIATGASQVGHGDDPAKVLANRQLLADQLGIALSQFVHGRQVHGHEVETVLSFRTGAWAHPYATHGADGLPAADGQATALRDLAMVVLVADCLPVALIGHGAVAMIHAGWRGLAAGVIGNGVDALRKLGLEGPIAAAIGPGAGVCCYEVGQEVHRVFADHGAQVRVRANLDLKAIAVRELHATGVTDVHDVGICTLCQDRSLFFSHRRDRGLTGRQAGVAWRS
jgi:polyphenol oxidase